jgi:hypothetical protein
MNDQTMALPVEASCYKADALQRAAAQLLSRFIVGDFHSFTPCRFPGAP